jgi:hypothetical protein
MGQTIRQTISPSPGKASSEPFEIYEKSRKRPPLPFALYSKEKRGLGKSEFENLSQTSSSMMSMNFCWE